jgi:hypothetical protein
MAKKTLEKVFTIHGHIKEMKIKTTQRFHLTLLEWLPSRTRPTKMLVRIQGKRDLIHLWW